MNRRDRLIPLVQKKPSRDTLGMMYPPPHIQKVKRSCPRARRASSRRCRAIAEVLVSRSELDRVHDFLVMFDPDSGTERASESSSLLALGKHSIGVASTVPDGENNDRRRQEAG